MVRTVLLSRSRFRTYSETRSMEDQEVGDDGIALLIVAAGPKYDAVGGATRSVVKTLLPPVSCHCCSLLPKRKTRILKLYVCSGFAFAYRSHCG